MTTTGIGVERSAEGSRQRPMSRAPSLSVASGENNGTRGAGGAGTGTAAESTPAARHHEGGQIRVRGCDRDERWTPVRHLVIFPARFM